MISAKIIGDSISPQGERLTSFELVFPRYILAEFNTHREFSRNSASSRAIPYEKFKQSVLDNPFIHSAWQKPHKGMQGKEYYTEPKTIEILNKLHLKARDNAVEISSHLNSIGVTKQVCNRYLEPFMWHKVIMTTSEPGLKNFFDLRCPQYYFEPANKSYKSRKEWIDNWNATFEEGIDVSRKAEYTDWYDLFFLQQNVADGEIHISLLAEKMYDAYNESKPKELLEGDYHIPFNEDIEFVELTTGLSLEDKIKVSIGMCARVSYTPVGDNSILSAQTYINIYDKMVKADPFHASPFEHVARVMTKEEYSKFIRGDIKLDEWLSDEYRKDILGWCRNFKGYVQERHIIEKLKWKKN